MFNGIAKVAVVAALILGTDGAGYGPLAQEQDKTPPAPTMQAPAAADAQSSTATKPQTDTATPPPPALGPDGKPLPPPAKVKGKAAKKKKEKAPKLTPVSISRGVLTVDGWTGKAAMNYDIADLKYIYISAPGIGTAVVSNVAFPGAKEQKEAFNDTSLKITVNDHVLELASDKRLLGKKPESAWVYLDPDYTFPSNFPAVGYGTVTKAPYIWPGSKPNAVTKGISAEAPPVPKALQPVMVAMPCPPAKPGTAAPATAPGTKPCTPAPAPPATATVPQTPPPASSK